MRSRSIITIILVYIILFVTVSNSTYGKIQTNDSTVFVELNEERNNFIPVLTFHHLQNDVPEGHEGTMVTAEEFESFLKTLAIENYSTITISEMNSFMKDGRIHHKRPFLITFDDGYLSNYEIAFPLLKKYKAKACIFVVASTVGKTPSTFPHFTWEQAKEMEKSKLIEIQNHSINHNDLYKTSELEYIETLLTAQSEIDSMLGLRKIKSFAYPYGHYTDNSIQEIEKVGFKLQFSTDDGLAKKGDLIIKRITIKHGDKPEDLLNRFRTAMK